jgi:integrase
MFLSKRSGVYYLWYLDSQGRRQKISTKSTTKSGALAFLWKFKPKELVTTTANAIEPRKKISDLFSEYQTHSATIHTKHTQRCYKDCMDQFLEAVGDKELLRVSVREIERFLEKKRTEVSNWTARRHHIVLASVFEAARRWGYITSNPCRQVTRAKMIEVHPVFFSEDELRILYNSIEDLDFRDLVLCAFATGMRLGEIVSLRWSQIDINKKIINVENTEGFTTKSKKCRVIPMNDMVLELLQRQAKKRACDYVFHSGGKKYLEDHVSKTFKKYVLKSGVNPKLHFHSLRHGFCSILVQKGVSLYEVQQLAGHSSPAVTQIYSHLQPELMHNTINKITLNLD